MSDFIYSFKNRPDGELTADICSIYHRNPPEVFEYHGEWGSLGVSRNLYNGFQPLETAKYIFVVIGGPVLCFRDNRFLTNGRPTEGTASVFEKFMAGDLRWDEDLSGPFAVFVIDKEEGKIECITDLMMFIPIYRYSENDNLVLGTHVDVLARTSGNRDSFDPVSLADFVINDVVTYPYTVYKKIFQCRAAAINYFEPFNASDKVKNQVNYWEPEEQKIYDTIDEAAGVLRSGVKNYVDRLTEGMDHVAQFLSAGEDSRVIAGLLPERLKIDAFIFLYEMDREGKIAQKVAETYGINLSVKFRDKTHYLDILPEASDLVGSGQQYYHAHALGFHSVCELNRYPAVFGGYLGDTLLKAYYARKIPGDTKFPFFPQVMAKGEKRSKPAKSTVFPDSILHEIDRRRQYHLENMKKLRNGTHHEWFLVWPRTMGYALPNFSASRRLFVSYEPFMCNRFVKTSAYAPVEWKLNHRLFKKAFHCCFKENRWIPHSAGYYPFLPFWINSPVQFISILYRKAGVSLGLIKENQGAWHNWNEITNTLLWNKTISAYTGKDLIVKDNLNIKDLKGVFQGEDLKINQKINLLQLLYQLNRV